MPNPSKELLDRLETMIIREAYIQRKNIEKQWNLPLNERIQKGKAIKGLCFSGHNEETEI